MLCLLVLGGCARAVSPPSGPTATEAPRVSVLPGSSPQVNEFASGQQSLAVGKAPRTKPKPSPIPMLVGPPPQPQPPPTVARMDLPLDTTPQARSRSRLTPKHHRSTRTQPQQPMLSSNITSRSPQTPSQPGNTAEGLLLSVESTLGQALLEGRGSQILYILVQIKGPKMVSVQGCTDLALVLDISGSMRGKPAEVAVGACLDVFQQARGADRCWLAAFASTTSFLIRGQKVGHLSPADIQSMLKSCQVGGGTMLGQAVADTLAEMESVRSAGAGRHMILITDGQTADQTQLESASERAWQRGISVSCIGIGQCNRKLLADIAQRCHGSFYALASSTALPDVLQRESTRARSLLARELELQVEFEPEVSLRRAFQVSPARDLPTRSQGSLTVITGGDLYRGQDREILLELQATPEAGSRRNLGKVKILARNPDMTACPPQTLPDLVARVSSSSNPNPQVARITDKIYARMGR